MFTYNFHVFKILVKEKEADHRGRECILIPIKSTHWASHNQRARHPWARLWEQRLTPGKLAPGSVCTVYGAHSFLTCGFGPCCQPAWELSISATCPQRLLGGREGSSVALCLPMGPTPQSAPTLSTPAAVANRSSQKASTELHESS